SIPRSRMEGFLRRRLLARGCFAGRSGQQLRAGGRGDGARGAAEGGRVMTGEEATRAILGQSEGKGFRARSNDVNDLGEAVAAESRELCARHSSERGLTPHQVLSALLSGAATLAVFCTKPEMSAVDAAECMGQMTARLYLQVARGR